MLMHWIADKIANTPEGWALITAICALFVWLTAFVVIHILRTRG